MTRAPKACAEMSCTALVYDGGSRCVEHRKSWSGPRTESSKTTGTRYFNKVIRPAVLERDQYRCQIRGPRCLGTADQADHIVELSVGGAPYELSNLRAACTPCHSHRTAVSAAAASSSGAAAPPPPTPSRRRRRRRFDGVTLPTTIWGSY